MTGSLHRPALPGLRLLTGLLLAASLLATGMLGCGRPPQQRHFYTLTYPMPRPSFPTPYPYTVRVKELAISSTYGSTQLVFRKDMHEIQFHTSRRWTDRPQRMVSDLIRKNLSHTRLVQQVTESLGETPPDYVLTGEIEAIEELDAGTATYAHLAVALRLVRFSNDTVVWRHSFDRRRLVPRGQVRSMVRATSQILEAEMLQVVEGLAQYFAGLTGQQPPMPAAGAPSSSAAPGDAAATGPAGGTMALPPAPADLPGSGTPQALVESLVLKEGEQPPGLQTQTASPGEEPTLADAHGAAPAEEELEGPPAPEVIGPDPGSPLNHHRQLLADDTDMPAGHGAIFLPALSEPDREPPLAVLRRGKLVAEGRMGTRIVVRPGSYEVRFGSGTVEQQRSVLVRVEEGRDTPVPPTWAALAVRVVDERFIPFRGSYEIIHVPSRQEYGQGYGAEEELGEELRVWVLQPGLYKIIQAGGTYRDRVNFATVQLEPGVLTRFTLVQDRETADFKGAGVLDPSEGLEDASRAWKVQALIGGDAISNRTDRLDDGGEQTQGWKLDLTLFFDGLLRFRREPHQWLTRLEVEEGQTRDPSTKRYSNWLDRLYGQSLYTFDLVSWFGPYARVACESQLLPQYLDSKEDKTYTIRELSGRVRTTVADRVELRGALAPLQLMEGTGANFRLLQTLPADLSLRLGVGARQSWARGLLEVTGDSVLEEVDDSFQEGFESTLVGLLRLSRWVTLSTELEGFFPFDAQPATVTWRNVASLRLVSFASLNYRVNYIRKTIRTAEEDKLSELVEQFFQLRFSYNLL